MAHHPSLLRNIRLYGWFKVFNKRVFIPSTAIYLVEVGHVGIVELGVIATVTGLVMLLAQMPTGYFADRHTRRSAMMIGAVLLALGAATLFGWPSLVGGLCAGVLSGIGFSFISGSGQALMHDSLEQWGQLSQYVKVMGRAQSKGLAGNVVLVGLVPMTYAVDKRMPFLLGVVAFLILFVLAWAFVEPERVKKAVDGSHVQQIVRGVRLFVSRQTMWLFIAIGCIYGLYAAPTDYTNLIIKDLGLAPQYIGWVFSGASILGAIGGFAIHHMERLSFKLFVYVDIAICCLLFVAIGLTQNMLVAIIATLLNLSFWRLRSILYQHHLLCLFKGTSNKATLISLLGLGEQVFVMLLPLMFAYGITHHGYYVAYTAIGLLTAAVLYVLTAFGFWRLRAVRSFAKMY